jgi:hypothetical protein
MSALPTASVIGTEAALPLETVLAAVKVAELSDLLRILKVASSELEKKGLKSAKGAKVPRKGSQPKGVLPAQLHKPRAWTEYVLARAQKEGWSAFTNGAQSFEGSVKGADGFAFADGKPFNMRHAMSLAKTYWSTATKTGSRPEWYAAFEKSYVAPAAPVPLEAAAPVAAAAAVAAPVAAAAPAAVTPAKKKVVAK